MYLHTHLHTSRMRACACKTHAYNYTPLNAIAYVDFRWNINNEPEARHRADPKTRIERFRNADHPRRASRGEEEERDTDDFFFLRDVRRVTLLFDSMGKHAREKWNS